MSEASNHSERVSRQKPVTLSEIRASMNWHFALGVNVITSYYDLNRFPDAVMRRLNAYVARLGTMLRLGRHVAPVAVLYPEQSLWGATVRGLASDGMNVQQAALRNVTDALLQSQVDFDYVDEQALRTSRAAGGRLTIGSRQYAALVLPCVTTLDRRLADAIARCARAGVRVIATHVLPVHARESGGDGRLANRFQRLAAAGRITFFPAANASFTRVVRYFAEVVLKPASPSILIHHRRERGRDIYFVANMARRPWRGTLTFDREGQCKEWDPESGASREIIGRPAAGKRKRVSATLPALVGRFFTFD